MKKITLYLCIYKYLQSKNKRAKKKKKNCSPNYEYRLYN